MIPVTDRPHVAKPIRHRHPITGHPLSPSVAVTVRHMLWETTLDNLPEATSGPWAVWEVFPDPDARLDSCEAVLAGLRVQVVTGQRWSFPTAEEALTYVAIHPTQCDECLTRILIATPRAPISFPS